MLKANTSLSLILIDAKAASVSSPFVVNEVPITVFDNLTTESDDLAEGKIDSKDQTPEKSLQVIRISCFKVKAMLLHIVEHLYHQHPDSAQLYELPLTSPIGNQIPRLVFILFPMKQHPFHLQPVFEIWIEPFWGDMQSAIRSLETDLVGGWVVRQEPDN